MKTQVLFLFLIIAAKISVGQNIAVTFDSLIYIQDIQFFDENSGLFYSSQDGLFRTVDGGNTWNLVDSEKGKLEVINDSVALYITNVSGHGVRKTSDKGSSWSTVGIGMSAFSVSCYDEQNCLVSTIDKLYKSTDGLATKVLVKSVPSYQNVFYSADTMIYYRNSIYYSVDNGISWNSNSSPQNWASLRFLDAKTIISFQNHSKELYKSEDLGNTWKNIQLSIPTSMETMYTLDFLDSKNGAAVCTTSTRLLTVGCTKDGGETWDFVEYSDSLDYVYNIYATTQNSVWVTGGKNTSNSDNMVYKMQNTVSCFSNNVTSMGGIEERSLKTYPNPVESTLFIKGDKIEFEIFDLNGLRVFNGFDNRIDVSGIASGIYFIVEKRLDGNRMSKFLKQ